jgi:beta-fructofuranosidase
MHVALWTRFYANLQFFPIVLSTIVSAAWGEALTADGIETMGNNSLFTLARWRPSSHFLAPAGWMNVRNDALDLRSKTDPPQDPCGPMYDPVRGLYHLHYQFHSNHIAWGMYYGFDSSY